jgi:hypothetical protein
VKRVFGLAGVLAVAACGSDFLPKNDLQSIRILAAKADLPYAHVGETVNLEVLADDGRKDPSKKPMRVFWFPAPCVGPPGDQYYFCYAAIESLFPIGVDLTPALIESTKTTIHIPENALDKVVKQPGQVERSITAYNFVVACAGHIERIPLKGGLGLNQLPIGCFDDTTHQELGPDAFVVGFTRVFVFDTRRNAVPVMDGITFQGQKVDFTKGITTTKCHKNKQGQCDTVKFDVQFNDSIAETDPDNVDSNGHVHQETIYVDWFTTDGQFRSDRKILFDGNLGRPPKTEVEYAPPPTPLTGTMWAVLHDNRGGTMWQAFPFTIQ